MRINAHKDAAPKIAAWLKSTGIDSTDGHGEFFHAETCDICRATCIGANPVTVETKDLNERLVKAFAVVDPTGGELWPTEDGSGYCCDNCLS